MTVRRIAIRLRAVAAGVVVACLGSLCLYAQQVTKEDVPGISNLSRIATTVACSGAITPDAVPKIKEMGFASIINLRESSESGANVEAEEMAAKAIGLRYYHIPLNAQSPDPEAAAKFLDAIRAPGTEPAFIHCSGGNRAAAMWLIKRLVIDHWDQDRAEKEAAELGLTNPKLEQWAVDYARSRTP